MTTKLSRENLASCLNRVIDQKLGTNQLIKDEEFLFFHINRNYFNVLYESAGANQTTYRKITHLTHVSGNNFQDNHNEIWKEMNSIGTRYHRKPTEQMRKREVFFPRTRQVRKFLKLDPFMADYGYLGGCEFELIINIKGERISTGQYRETYNFGASGVFSTFFGLHDQLDIQPHHRFSQYTDHYKTLETVKIVDANPPSLESSRGIDF